jgi:hypothetical protein
MIAQHDPIVAADVYTANIVDTFHRATTAEIIAGRGWYPTAGDIASVIAAGTGRDAETVAYVIAALSPRNPWRWNVADAYAYCAAADAGAQRPSATTFGANQRKAWSIATYETADPWTGAAPKVRAFVRAILGDRDAVVVDIWAMRVATRGARTEARGDYDAIANAYRRAAYLVGEHPRDLQAIVWLVAQREDGDGRSTRTARTIKAGTHPSVARYL